MRSQAQFYLRQGLYEKAALCFSKVDVSFDESVLSLLQCISTAERDTSNALDFQPSFDPLDPSGLIALRIYLTEVLRKLPPSSKSQRTMISTWLSEIMLHQISIKTLLTSDSSDRVKENDVGPLFKDLLRNNK